MEVIFENDDGSALVTYDYKKHEELIKKCVDEIENLLEIKPPITVFGRLCNQQRNIGFFFR